MRLGIFAKTFPRSTLEQTFDAIKSLGLHGVQFNFTCAGLPPLPDYIEPVLAERIRSGLESRSIAMAAVSGTCNLIHPDVAQRDESIRRLQILIENSPKLGTSVVTLCTGTRDPNDMWRAHPQNDSVEAWHDLLRSLERLLPIAESHRIALGIEPEPANVIGSAPQARRLLNEMKSSSLRIVFDAANLVEPYGLSKQREILEQAFDLLGEDIVLAHAKDLGSYGTGGRSTGSAPSSHPHSAADINAQSVMPLSTVAAGKGDLDYPFFLSLLQQAGFDGSIILHSLSETEALDSVRFIRASLDRTYTFSHSRTR